MLSRIEIEIIGALLLIGFFVGLWMHHDSVEQTQGAAKCNASVAEAQKLGQQHAEQVAADYELQLAAAKVTLDETPLAKPVSTPVFVCLPTPVRPAATGATPSKAEDVHTDSAGDGGRSGERDIRPGLEAFKLRYGTILKNCQYDLDVWPTHD